MDFTQEEKERINQLYGNDFADITPDDATLIARWEAYKAVNDDKHAAEIEAIKAESDARLVEIQEQYAIARANLKELHDLAVARFERLDNES